MQFGPNSDGDKRNNRSDFGGNLKGGCSSNVVLSKIWRVCAGPLEPHAKSSSPKIRRPLEEIIKALDFQAGGRKTS